MVRGELITYIQSVRDHAISLGFDWPSTEAGFTDPETATTEELQSFYNRITDYIREHSIPEYPEAGDLMLLITNTEFSTFTKADWWAFGGCETANPKIGYTDDFTIVIDGDVINVIHENDYMGGKIYRLKEI